MTECSSRPVFFLVLFFFVLSFVVVLLFLTFPGVGRDQPEGRYQESTLSGHAVLSPTVVLLSACASGSVRDRVRGVSAEWPSVSRPDGRRCLAVWPLDSRRVAWPHFTR